MGFLENFFSIALLLVSATERETMAVTKKRNYIFLHTGFTFHTTLCSEREKVFSRSPGPSLSFLFSASSRFPQEEEGKTEGTHWRTQKGPQDAPAPIPLGSSGFAYPRSPAFCSVFVHQVRASCLATAGWDRRDSHLGCRDALKVYRWLQGLDLREEVAEAHFNPPICIVLVSLTS